MNTPDVSVVVCTRNRATLLADALASLYDLSTDEFVYEIVVVDNGSTDGTRAVVKHAGTESKHTIRYVCEAETGIVAARNRGIAEAQGNWIAFFDDDQLADWHWLAELYRGASERGALSVGGAVNLALPADCQRSLAPQVRMLLGEALHGDEPFRYGGRVTPGCGNWMLARSAFERVGVFQQSIAGRGEDTDLFERLERAGIPSWYVPTAVIHHMTPAERLERAYLVDLGRRMGCGMAIRQRAALGLAGFTLWWLAKGVRTCLVEYPLLAWSGLRGGPEARLGRECQLAVSLGFLTGACSGESTAAREPAANNFAANDLASNPSAVKPSTAAPEFASADSWEANSQPAAEEPGPALVAESSDDREPAPMFVIRPAEPTAVMDYVCSPLVSPSSSSYDR
jgi:GT2 family glycosyltransferase